MLVLSLESSTSVCSVALHNNGRLVDYVFIPEPRAASAQLMAQADALLRKHQINPAQLTAVAVSSGPGSYTGLRISVSAAKGICVALNIPLVAVNSLQTMAHSVIQSGVAKWYCPMIDARRMEVYCCLLDENGQEIHPVQAKILDADSFKNELEDAKIAFFGDGSLKFKSEVNHANALFVGGVHPSAIHLGAMASKKLANGIVEDVANFEPFYLKDFLIKTKQKPIIGLQS